MGMWHHGLAYVGFNGEDIAAAGSRQGDGSPCRQWLPILEFGFIFL